MQLQGKKNKTTEGGQAVYKIVSNFPLHEYMPPDVRW